MFIAARRTRRVYTILPRNSKPGILEVDLPRIDTVPHLTYTPGENALADAKDPSPPMERFPDVIVHTTIAKLKSHPDYPQAKAGIAQAGIQLRTDLVKAEKIVLPDVDAIVPVFQTAEKESTP